MGPAKAVDLIDDYSSSDGESTPLYGEGQRTQPERKNWDAFRNPPHKDSKGSASDSKSLETLTKIVKILSIIFTFIIVLGSATIVKGTALFMTSQFRSGKETLYCNRALGGEKQFSAVLPDEERFVWMWCLIFSFAVPELGTLFRAWRMCFFKSVLKPAIADFFILFSMETLHTIGMALLFFVILPNMDVLKGAMLTNCLCFVPGVLAIISRNMNEEGRTIKIVFDVAALAIQATGFVVWPMLEGGAKPELWLTPVTTFLVSCGWWENYVSVSKESPLAFIKPLRRILRSLNETRYYCYLFISLWKMIVFLCSIIVILALQGENISDFFTLLPTGFSEHTITVTEIVSADGSTSIIDGAVSTPEVYEMDAYYNAAIYVFLIQMIAAYVCYIFGKFACKTMIQAFAYAFPVNLTVPLSLSLLVVMCGIRNSDPCAYYNVIPDYLFFDAPTTYSVGSFITSEFAWIWLLWLFSQTWITIHLWSPKCERLAPTERLFIIPMYNGLLIDQSLALNRRRDDENHAMMEADSNNGDSPRVSTNSVGEEVGDIQPSDYITRIYACTTMWHETREEMLEMLKSLFRMDIDQSARRIARKYLEVDDPDYYEFETHILFDDAYVTDETTNEPVVNSFVTLLVSVMDEAASIVHARTIRLDPPIKYPTPYGGRLVWTLPGKTKIYAHLKDKNKIRHRKRWSQVMYMYYLLGHKLMELPISVYRKEVIARNTYLLAMDGDIDFQPEAVLLLVDLMKKNINLGAACGRIHPVGSGPMQWYQSFEYAVGHWLQKSTEHVIGCVLCSPGAFSLFRAKGLMDDCVMNKYTIRPYQARHYVQYDQGEDRWLCTLLLQRGYRVEYAAASDAFTRCPEGFNEFYNQRRRWVPSTTANILDLLMDSKRTIKVNDNISFPYIMYQIMLMGGTVLGPGTIFLMLQGALVSAFRIDNMTSFWYNIIPLLLFMVICYFCKTDIQLTAALIITIVYCLVMMAVLVGLGLQIQEDGIFAPSSLFLIIVIVEFIIAAIVHPKEFHCLPNIVIYYITIPSMYMLLIIYSVFNLNNISWGTREVPKKITEEEALRLEAEKKKKKSNGVFDFFKSFSDKAKNDEGSIEFSFANLFKIMCCTYPKPLDEQQQFLRITETLEGIKKRLDNIERIVDPASHISSRRRSQTMIGRENQLGILSEDPEVDEDDIVSLDSETVSSEPKQVRDDNVNPYWIEDRKLKKGDIDYLPSSEIQFWMDFIGKYLYPIDEDPEEKKKISSELKALRDMCAFAFFMINALFVLVVFLLQQNKDTIFITWPVGAKTNVTFSEDDNEVQVTKEFLELEPIGMVFALFFGVVLIIQFFGMMFHRLSTLCHVLASTDVNLFGCGKKSDLAEREATVKEFLTIVNDLQRLPAEANESEDKKKPGVRKTITANSKAVENPAANQVRLSRAFKQNFNQLLAQGDEGIKRISRFSHTRRETVSRLVARHSIVAAERRKSQMSNGKPNENVITSALPRSSIKLPGGYFNKAFDGELDDNGMVRRPSVKPKRNSVTWGKSDISLN